MLKKKINTILILAKKEPGLFAGRLVLVSAFCAFIFVCGLYWVGTNEAEQSKPLPLSRAAQAEGMRMSAEVLAAVLAKEAENYSTPKTVFSTHGVDDAYSGPDTALPQEGSVAQAKPEQPRPLDSALTATLKRVYPDLAENGYFVLWRGTTDVCSPLTPDTAGQDFGGMRDAEGAYIIRDLEKLARNGGGFYNFALRYNEQNAKSQADVSHFLAYSTPVQGTDLHLTLWKPVDPKQFNLQAEIMEDSGNWSLLGLCMAGLSFLGVSVLVRELKA